MERAVGAGDGILWDSWVVAGARDRNARSMSGCVVENSDEILWSFECYRVLGCLRKQKLAGLGNDNDCGRTKKLQVHVEMTSLSALRFK